jgi:hypothetical protein
MREEWIAVRKRSLQRMEDASAKMVFAAILGDAQAAIELFSRPPYSGRREYRDWLQEGKRKAERQCRRAVRADRAGGRDV